MRERELEIKEGASRSGALWWYVIKGDFTQNPFHSEER